MGQGTFFTVENHGLGFGGAGPHPSRFTLGCEPSQCTLKVLEQNFFFFQCFFFDLLRQYICASVSKIMRGGWHWVEHRSQRSLAQHLKICKVLNKAKTVCPKNKKIGPSVLMMLKISFFAGPSTAGHYDDIKEALEKNHPELAIKKTKEILENSQVLPLAIAITGESGTGKSSLVNALRGVDQSDPCAAPTGVVETTMVPTSYAHPLFPMVTVWDLPGVGTSKMLASHYLDFVNFKKYDFFIIVSNTRFRENDANLARAIKRMNKNFYFVRSKIDQDLYNEERTRTTFDKSETLKSIRDKCIQELESLGVVSPKVFLLSSFDHLQFDFSAFMMTLESELSVHQRESLLRAVPSYSLEIIEKKKQLLGSKIPGLVAGAVVGGILPIISIGINEGIMRGFAKECLLTFGLTEQTLVLLSRESKVPVEELKAVMKLTMSPDISVIIAQVFNVLTLTLLPSAMILSGVAVHSRLRQILTLTAEDAQNVLKKALGLE